MRKVIYLATLLFLIGCSVEEKEEPELPIGGFQKAPFMPHKEDIGRIFWDHDSIPYTMDPYGNDIHLMRIERNGVDSFVCVGAGNQYDFNHECYRDYIYYGKDEIRSEECPSPKFYIDGNWDTIHREKVKDQIWKKFYWEIEKPYHVNEKGDTILRRKVIRGPAGWDKLDYYLNSSERTYEYEDTTKSYIGFRPVHTYLGRGSKDNLDSI